MSRHERTDARRSAVAGAVFIVLLIALSVLGSGCATSGQTPSHNQYGGYIEACGDLPPLVGDDC
jgi:hypothetical protein